MAALASQQLAVGGTAPTYTAVASGDTAATGNKRILHIRNRHTATITATIITPGTVQGIGIADPQLAVTAGNDGFIPLDPVYAGADGRATINYDVVTATTSAVLDLP